MSSSLRSFFLLSAFEKFKKKNKKKEEKKEWFRDERRSHHNFKTCFLNARIERKKTPLFSDQNVDDFGANVDEEARRRRQKSSRVFEVSLRRARM